MMERVAWENMLQAVFLVAMAPLIQGFIQWCKARLQNRRGASPWQPYHYLYKLFAKDLVIAHSASWITWVTPFICFGAAFAVAGLVPSGLLEGMEQSDLLLLVYLYALSRFFLALAGLDAGGSFGGMGSSREMYLSVLVEPALLLAILAAVGTAGSTELGVMAREATLHPFTLPYILATVAFFLVLIAECGRIPVDNPDTHLELTMFQEAMLLEYSGRHLALLQWGSFIRQLVLMVLFIEIFFPWSWTDLVPVLAFWLIVKLFGVAMLLAMVETSTAKMRLFRLPNFLAASGLLSLLALVAR
jgi:formate hydrogenlyase subunit 4